MIKDVFEKAHNYFNILTHCHNLCLGSQQVGKMFPLAMLSFNLHLMFYRNQTAAYFKNDHLLMQCTPELYLGKAELVANDFQ